MRNIPIMKLPTWIVRHCDVCEENTIKRIVRFKTKSGKIYICNECLSKALKEKK